MLFAKKERPKVGANNHSYHHAAKPIPWHLADTAMLDKINSQKELRRKKITTDAKIKMLKEWKNLPDVAQQFSEASETHREDIFEPEIHTISKVKKVPDFV